MAICLNKMKLEVFFLTNMVSKFILVTLADLAKIVFAKAKNSLSIIGLLFLLYPLL